MTASNENDGGDIHINCYSTVSLRSSGGELCFVRASTCKSFDRPSLNHQPAATVDRTVLETGASQIERLTSWPYHELVLITLSSEMNPSLI